jgi:hypothetical protein
MKPEWKTYKPKDAHKLEAAGFAVLRGHPEERFVVLYKRLNNSQVLVGQLRLPAEAHFVVLDVESLNTLSQVMSAPSY